MVIVDDCRAPPAVLQEIVPLIKRDALCLESGRGQNPARPSA
jgi:hypothetical protein